MAELAHYTNTLCKCMFCLFFLQGQEPVEGNKLGRGPHENALSWQLCRGDQLRQHELIAG